MSYFFWLSIALLVCTLIFYAVFFAFIYYWHEKKTTVVVVPMLFTFEFLIIGFLVISILAVSLTYWPDVWQAFSEYKFTI